MGAATWLVEEVAEDSALSDADRAWLRENWAPSVSTWLRDTATQRPSDSQSDERLLGELLRLVAEPLRRVGPDAIAAELQRGLSRGFEEIVRTELRSDEVERQLALRLVQQGVTTLAHVIECWTRAFRSVSSVAHAELMEESAKLFAADVDLETFGEGDRLLLRFLLDLFVAVEAVDANLESLTWWARRVAGSARYAEVWLRTDGTRALQAEAARIQARHAWQGWTGEDVSQELVPWNPPRPASP